MLRRDPTRIELGTEDLRDFEQVKEARKVSARGLLTEPNEGETNATLERTGPIRGAAASAGARRAAGAAQGKNGQRPHRLATAHQQQGVTPSPPGAVRVLMYKRFTGDHEVRARG